MDPALWGQGGGAGAARRGLGNFGVLASHVRVPPALEAICSAPDSRVEGFLAAGHVCTVMGTAEYEPIARRHAVPVVATGFEPLDILQGVAMAVEQLERGAGVQQPRLAARGAGGAPAAAGGGRSCAGFITERRHCAGGGDPGGAFGRAHTPVALFIGIPLALLQPIELVLLRRALVPRIGSVAFDAGLWLKAEIAYDGRRIKGLNRAVLGPVLGPDGKPVADLPKDFADAKALLPLFKQMLFVRTFDSKAIALQRTGKLGTYASCLGHEATHVGIGASMFLPSSTLTMENDSIACGLPSSLTRNSSGLRSSTGLPLRSVTMTSTRTKLMPLRMTGGCCGGGFCGGGFSWAAGGGFCGGFSCAAGACGWLD